jgi:hypothetical protein
MYIAISYLGTTYLIYIFDEQKVAAQKHTLDAQREKLMQADAIISQQQDVSIRYAIQQFSIISIDMSVSMFYFSVSLNVVRMRENACE